jgi:hypothetical protein
VEVPRAVPAATMGSGLRPVTPRALRGRCPRLVGLRRASLRIQGRAVHRRAQEADPDPGTVRRDGQVASIPAAGIVPSQSHEVTAEGYRPDGEVRFEGKTADASHAAPLLERAAILLGSNNAQLPLPGNHPAAAGGREAGPKPNTPRCAREPPIQPNRTDARAIASAGAPGVIRMMTSSRSCHTSETGCPEPAAREPPDPCEPR